jgi:hypothetical protein
LEAIAKGAPVRKLGIAIVTAYNAELVVLRVADGRVVSKKYLPD